MPKCSGAPQLIRDLAAGGGDQSVTCRNVPFAGRGEAGIDIGAALRDPAELDGGAERFAHRAGPALDEGVRAVVGVGAADGGDPLGAGGGSGRVAIGFAAPDLPPSGVTVARRRPDKTSPDRPERRRADDAE